MVGCFYVFCRLVRFIIEASIDIAGSKSVSDMFKLVVHDCFLCLSFTHTLSLTHFCYLFYCETIFYSSSPSYLLSARRWPEIYSTGQRSPQRVLQLQLSYRRFPSCQLVPDFGSHLIPRSPSHQGYHLPTVRKLSILSPMYPSIWLATISS